MVSLVAQYLFIKRKFYKKLFIKSISQEEGLQKIKHYCAYQERCHSEVKIKLYSLGLSTSIINEIMVSLIEENYLNEERFAMHFASGKFKLKQWGRNKIKFELKTKQVSEFLIKKALASINDEDYIITIKKIYNKYYLTTKGISTKQRELKTKNYLLQKGYEFNVINNLFKD